MRSFRHIADLIKTKRTTHAERYSQSDLSHLLGYKNGQFISNVERGLCSIPLKMLKKVSQILEISPLELKDAVLKDYRETLEMNFQSSTGIERPGEIQKEVES
ncbi:MAG: helix-turn-helix transcriptional regulator [Halobacteriovoraceae bacterium]|jgi:transcriptional regulator with XRE-family HTH domain|nr:helix-turn-helix transcriptional regulator [Halobacteriovoraceae bacterium]MBT5093383.1 helix-turn-helix transcriptional regulator [Halobacteriovoraceae bacterium]